MITIPQELTQEALEAELVAGLNQNVTFIQGEFISTSPSKAVPCKACLVGWMMISREGVPSPAQYTSPPAAVGRAIGVDSNVIWAVSEGYESARYGEKPRHYPCYKADNENAACQDDECVTCMGNIVKMNAYNATMNVLGMA